MAGEKILVVDDDIAIRHMLNRTLASAGMAPFTVANGKEALTAVEKDNYDVILMDYMMPVMNGFETIRALRENGVDTPVIMLSHNSSDADTLEGLESGADDYIYKPFNPTTLTAKIRALLRRSRMRPKDNNVIEAGKFTYDMDTLRLYKGTQEIPLTSKENSLIKLLLDNVGHAVPITTLYTVVWGNDQIDKNTVMVYMNRLRKKIEDDANKPTHIVTVRGVGYRFMP